MFENANLGKKVEYLTLLDFVKNISPDASAEN